MDNKNILNRLSEDWNDIKDIVVYGFGRTAIRNVDKLAEDFNISMIIDNDSRIHGMSYKDCKVQNFEETKESLVDKKIVVATSSIAYYDIAKQLQGIGLQENRDFCRLKDFMAEWYWKNKHQVCLSQTFSSITSHCTFRCKYCNMLMPYFQDSEHYEYDEQDIVRDFEEYFKVVDYVADWSIMGGEPLLNKHLSQIIEGVAKRFGKQIGYIQIVSNGSVLPNEMLINTMRAYDVRMRLSDYTHAINYQKKLDEVKRCLEANGIPYEISNYDKWLNPGIEFAVGEYSWLTSKDQIRKHMRLCSPGCHVLNDKKLFFCGQAFAWVKKGICELHTGDCIELAKCNGTIEEKETVLRYCIGFPESSNGYISTCAKCFGMGSDNQHIVDVAEQMTD